MANGVIFIVASTALLTVGLFLPRLVHSIADPVQVSFLRYVGGLLWLIAIRGVRSIRERTLLVNRLNPASQIWHVVRALIGFGTLTMTVLASRLLPIGDVQAILACNGLLVLGWLVARGAETLRMSAIVGTILCVGGAWMSSDVRLASYPLVGYLAALAAAACWAAEIVVFRHAVAVAAGKTSLLFINMVGVVLLMVPAALRWRSVGGTEVGALLSVGILLVASQAAMIKALERMPLSLSIPFRYLNVPIALGLGLAFLREIPSAEALAGALSIMVGGSLLSYRLSRDKKRSD
ncbi:hypothetical protein bAD24_p01855 (plasmid) [Burkholderia sp. AD24]|nr:hypothetical protein bAD24_p01855 [Burkholderia sp. AD24]